MFIGANHIHIPELDSTNRFAMDLVRSEKPSEGTVVSTDFQTAGRGQQGKSWQSSRSMNLNSSVVLYPGFLSSGDQFLLNMAVALAVCEAVAELCGAICSLKWPNDVYFGNKKIAGILIENTWAGSRWQAAIVGIGLNVNQQEFAGFPATSLRNIGGNVLSHEECFRVLFRYLEARYLMLRGVRKEQTLADYNDMLLHQNKVINLQFQDGTTIPATLLGATRSGGIRVLTASGEEQVWHHPQARIAM